MIETSLQSQLKDLVAHVQQGDSLLVRELCESLAHSHSVEAQLGLSQAFQKLGDFDRMVSAAHAAVLLAPANRTARARLVECHIYNGRIDTASELLHAMEQESEADPSLLQQVAALYLHCSKFADAHRCYVLSARLKPSDPGVLYNLASSCVSMGEIEKADDLYTRVIALKADDFDAYQNRSTLRTWSTASNHIDALKDAFHKLSEDHPGRVALGYALAKEYEDLHEFKLAFQYLEIGAMSRRKRLAYRVEGDVAAMARIRKAFSADVLSKQSRAAYQDESLFVLGLPRSGTTLVDRILCSHSRVESLGEINAFAFSLMKFASGPGDKLDMIDRSATRDFAQMGESYRRSIRSYGVDSTWLLNKTPSNYLYVGLIHLALPSAKTVHLSRHPMDSCFAMFKTLFRMGYPFSYSLEDLGHYYLAYHQLMQHWRETIPQSFHDVSYEELIGNQETVTERLLKYCDLPWENGCMNFHQNAAPAATASAIQVRKPLYASSVQMWRNYETQLAPLVGFLQNHGIDCHQDSAEVHDTSH